MALLVPGYFHLCLPTSRSRSATSPPTLSCIQTNKASAGSYLDQRPLKLEDIAVLSVSLPTHVFNLLRICSMPTARSL